MQFNFKISFMTTSTANFINLAFMFYFSICVCVCVCIKIIFDNGKSSIHDNPSTQLLLQGNVILILAWKLTKTIPSTHLRFIMHWMMNFVNFVNFEFCLAIKWPKKRLCEKIKCFFGVKDSYLSSHYNEFEVAIFRQ
jgi:hypothetical protein